MRLEFCFAACTLCFDNLAGAFLRVLFALHAHDVAGFLAEFAKRAQGVTGRNRGIIDVRRDTAPLALQERHLEV